MSETISDDLNAIELAKNRIPNTLKKQRVPRY